MSARQSAVAARWSASSAVRSGTIADEWLVLAVWLAVVAKRAAVIMRWWVADAMWWGRTTQWLTRWID
ncbi:MAG: hypothetical protein AAFQ95_00010 [Cyanobacteria bacterium J06621_3]